MNSHLFRLHPNLKIVVSNWPVTVIHLLFKYTKLARMIVRTY